MTRGRLVVHAHFYQPFRRDPFTGRVPPDPDAAPFRDWNTRISAECYRANAELGNLGRISWNLGPTLANWMATEEPDTLDLVVAADRAAPGAPAIAQAYHHAILPLAGVRDRRTEIHWGLRDFELRFGRRPAAMWLPETAVDLDTLRALHAAGIGATILAPWQSEVSGLDVRRPYRVDLGGDAAIAVVFYDGDLSGTVSFAPDATADADRFARERVAPRLAVPLPDGSAPLVVIATDGELYGHHQPFRDLFLQRLTAPGPDTADRGFDVVDLATVLAGAPVHTLPAVAIRDRTSWSCHHGVLRWTAECPDVPDGRWKGPLRAALERLAGAIDAVTDAEAARLPGAPDPWPARDDYVDVVTGAVEGETFAAGRLSPAAGAAERDRLLELMEAQRWRLAMFASDGWFWDDPSRTETKQVLRAAACATRLAFGTGSAVERRLVEDLGALASPALGIDGATIYRRALAEIGQPPPPA